MKKRKKKYMIYKRGKREKEQASPTWPPKIAIDHLTPPSIASAHIQARRVLLFQNFDTTTKAYGPYTLSSVCDLALMLA
jgi:hypothetical protein